MHTSLNIIYLSPLIKPPMVLVERGLNSEQVSLIKPIYIENCILVLKQVVLITRVVFIAELYYNTSDIILLNWFMFKCYYGNYVYVTMASHCPRKDKSFIHFGLHYCCLIIHMNVKHYVFQHSIIFGTLLWQFDEINNGTHWSSGGTLNCRYRGPWFEREFLWAQEYKNLSPVTGADGIFQSQGGTVSAVLILCQGTAETVTREPEITISTGY